VLKKKKRKRNVLPSAVKSEGEEAEKAGSKRKQWTGAEAQGDYETKGGGKAKN